MEGPLCKKPSISGNILLYKSEPKVRRVAIEAEAKGLEKRDTPQETNRASAAAAARVSPTTEKGTHQFTSPMFVC